MEVSIAGLRSDMESALAALRRDMDTAMASLRRDMDRLELRLTVRLGGMMAVAVAILAAIMKL
jgi:hypothetical protein